MTIKISFDRKLTESQCALANKIVENAKGGMYELPYTEQDMSDVMALSDVAILYKADNGMSGQTRLFQSWTAQVDDEGDPDEDGVIIVYFNTSNPTISAAILEAIEAV